MRVGVISDTHGLVRPEALEALAKSEVILHAGDVGGPHVLEALRAITRDVRAIRGNNDEPAALRKKRKRGLDPEWAAELPPTLTLELAGRRVHLVHAIADLAIDPLAEGVALVISGHSHAPSIDRRGGVLYLNPGSAGPRRFELPVTVARVRITKRGLDAEIVPLTIDR